MTLVNHLLTDKILQTEEIDNKIAFAFAVERLVENGAKKFHEGLPKTRFPLFKNTTKSITVQKNDKPRIAEVNRDILSWLVNLWASSRKVVNCKKAMEYPLSPVPLSTATT